MVPNDQKQQPVFPDAARLEDRILMSATPLGDSATEMGDAPMVFAPLSGDEPTVFAPLSDTTAPTALGIVDVIASEDANNEDVILSDFFIDDVDPSLTYQVVDISDPAPFANGNVQIQGSRLTLDYAPDAFGSATLTIRAVDDAGNFVDDDFRVNVLPLNDRPTTTGLTDITVDEDASATVIDLFASFDDVEDADNALTFTVTQNTNPDLFSSIVVDGVAGTMTFNYAPDAYGSSQITIRATDSEGAYVEMAVSGSEFPIYDFFAGEIGTHYPEIDWDQLRLFFHGEIFEVVDGEYDFENVDEARLRGFTRITPAGVPITVDIEQALFDNTPEGRDRWAEVLHIMRDERPDIEVGLYDFMPRSSWYNPFNAYRAVEDLERGIVTFYSQNSADFLASYASWQADNDLLMTEPVSPEFGGLPLAEMVTSTQPSLFTPYRNEGMFVGVLAVDVEIDVISDSFSVNGLMLVDGLKVRLRPGIGGVLPQGVNANDYYYVVNDEADSFQLATEKGGQAIALDGTAAGALYIELFDHRPLHYDPAVQYWDVFATDMIAESRQFGHDVIPWISPSKQGIGVEYLEKNFFRTQLDLMFEYADGVNIYDPSHSVATLESNQGWWETLTEFVDYINSPTQFTITVNPVNDAPTSAGIPDLVLPAGVAGGFVNLDDFFGDSEDKDGLTYQISHVSIPEAFDSISLSNSILEVDFADGRTGISFVTIQAIDSGGLFVEDTFMVQIGELGMPEPEPFSEGTAPLSWTPPGENNAQPFANGWALMDTSPGESSLPSGPGEPTSLAERCDLGLRDGIANPAGAIVAHARSQKRQGGSSFEGCGSDATTLTDQLIAIPIETVVLPQ